MKKLVTLILLIVSFSFAQSYLSVFTESSSSEIFIDGKKIANEQVVKHPVENGEHYVVVKLQGNTAFSQVVNVPANDTKVVVAGNFVDYKTNVANRGAIEVEAARIRETRGNTGFGLFGVTPAGGLSFKQWINNRIGIQAIGYTNTIESVRDDQAGGRLLINFADRVFAEDVFSTYFAIGAGKKALRGLTEEDFDEEISEFAFGIEFNIGQVMASMTRPQAGSRTVIVNNNDQTKSFDDMVGMISGLILLSTAQAMFSVSHISMEIGGEQHFKRFYYEEEPQRWNNLKFSGGVHVYF